jgi:hypothetical protein
VNEPYGAMGHESVFGVVRDATPEILLDNFPNSSEKVNVSLSRGYTKRLVHFRGWNTQRRGLREGAKNERIKMLPPKSLNHFINAVNSPLQKFPKTPLRLCDLA